MTPTTAPHSAEREAFEAWYSENGKWPNAVLRGSDGHYMLAASAAAWNVWQAKAAAVPHSAGWQPIETAPKGREQVLLRVPTRHNKRAGFMACQGYWMESFWLIFNADEAVQRVEPTHWMPLPPPPGPHSAAAAQPVAGDELQLWREAWRKATAQMAMEVVMSNIEQGNGEAINSLLLAETGGAA